MNPIREFWQVLAVIFPLTLVVPRIMQPLLDMLSIEPNNAISILLVDVVIVACAVFIFLPWVNKIVENFKA
ncbi:hypothetical protein [Vibrio parahaemolyticus]|uniref:hypothetical protein n=1 Tax=Vibrio parahaemolyticus TaxID=670 RepID=UPI00236186DD|nr:hypothetical protein [Vibrio parahaemolyticus]ELA6588979.1 hypothetical protein [Vibrio alginolyticus]HCM1552995.1 hypothetical protein [Vibrio parahaemolyticus]HDU8574210.1 hypothetical protein [Vibrio parahaemolyticus]